MPLQDNERFSSHPRTVDSPTVYLPTLSIVVQAASYTYTSIDLVIEAPLSSLADTVGSWILYQDMKPYSKPAIRTSETRVGSLLDCVRRSPTYPYPHPTRSTISNLSLSCRVHIEARNLIYWTRTMCQDSHFPRLGRLI